MPIPMQHQITGATFLAQRNSALLADAPRVGKTGSAIMAADYVMARTILVITTASGRPNWGRDLREWQVFPRNIQVIYEGSERVRPDADAVVVGWGMFYDKRIFDQLAARMWDVIVPDEAHYACNVMNGEKPTRRTIALYGKGGLVHRAGYRWPETGTPMPNGAPDDLFPMLRGLAPERLGPYAQHDKFMKHFCVVKEVWKAGRSYSTVVAGKNTAELNERLDGFWLRRTQEDVGIRPPLYSLFSLAPGNFGSGTLRDALAEIDDERAAEILAAAEAGDTRALEMHMGPLRRITGTIKAHAVVEAVREELDNGLDKIVLGFWHTGTGTALRKGLAAYGVSYIDGSSTPRQRERERLDFQQGRSRVLAGQLQAAGENIDLSASCNLLIVEPSFMPKDMSQFALRITNHTQKRQCLVRFCALTGSIDEAFMAILHRKVATINQVMEH